MPLRLLALLPFLGILAGAAFTNQVTPMIFGMPLVLAWQVACVIGSAAVMGIIYLCDPANRDGHDDKILDAPKAESSGAQS
jgi:hypothetical protein